MIGYKFTYINSYLSTSNNVGNVGNSGIVYDGSEPSEDNGVVQNGVWVNDGIWDNDDPDILETGE